MLGRQLSSLGACEPAGRQDSRDHQRGPGSVQLCVITESPTHPLWAPRQQNAQVSASFLCHQQTLPEHGIDDSSPLFPVPPILSLCCSVIHFWREVRTSQNQSLGFKKVIFNIVLFSVFMCVWLESHSWQSERGMSRRAEAGRGRAGLQPLSLSPLPLPLSLSPSPCLPLPSPKRGVAVAGTRLY